MSPLPNQRWNLWPVCIIGFFAVAVAGCVTFVIFCNLHPADLVATDYYEQELRFQAQMEKVSRTQALPGRAQITFEPVSRQITLALPLAGAGDVPTGRIHLYRPSAAGLDRELPLHTTPEGKQSLDAATLDPGLWRVKVTWTAGAQEYYADQNVVVSARGS